MAFQSSVMLSAAASSPLVHHRTANLRCATTFNEKMVMPLNLLRMHTTQKIDLRSFCSNSSQTNHLEQTQQGKSSNDQQHHEQVIEMGYADRFTFHKAVEASVKLGDFKRAEELMSEMKNRGFEPNHFDYNLMIDGLFEHGRMRDAEKLFDEMCETNVTPDVIIYNTLIYWYCKAGELEKAFGVKERMEMENVEPSVETFNSLLLGLTDFDGYFSKCIELYEDMKNRGVRPTTLTYALLISRCGKVQKELVEKLFNEMLQFNLVPDGVIYNRMINFYVNQCGDVQKSASLYDEMVGQGIHPHKSIYNMLIKAHLKEGNLARVNDLVYNMKAKGIGPKTRTYEVLIKGLCKLKDFDAAYGWYREMVRNGFVPKFNICKGLVDGLKQQGKFTEAQLVCSEMCLKGIGDDESRKNLNVEFY